MTAESYGFPHERCEVFEAGNIRLELGGILMDARLSYRAIGACDGTRDCVLLPTYYTGTDMSYRPWVGPGRPIDPAHFDILIVNRIGGGRSSSPSNAVPSQLGPGFPEITIGDDIDLQRRLLDHLGIKRLRLVAGWSLGAAQAIEWAARRPDDIDAMFALCGAATCTGINRVFLEGVAAPLLTVIEEADNPAALRRGLRAFGIVYAGWAYSAEFFDAQEYRGFGANSPDDILRDWADEHTAYDPHDLLCALRAWERLDTGRSCGGSWEDGLQRVRARTVLMPSSTDRYFTLAQAQREASLIRGATLMPLESPLGHIAGRPGIRAAEQARVDEGLALALRDASLSSTFSIDY